MIEYLDYINYMISSTIIGLHLGYHTEDLQVKITMFCFGQSKSKLISGI